MSSPNPRKKPDPVYHIREYCSGDFRNIRKLWEQTGLNTPGRNDNRRAISESLKTGGKLFLLCIPLPEKIIGTSWLSYDGRRMYLHHFCIRPDFQGKRLSHLLLKHSLKYAHRCKTQLKLEVHRENQAAIHLYRSYGFEILGNYEVYIQRNP